MTLEQQLCKSKKSHQKQEKVRIKRATSAYKKMGRFDQFQSPRSLFKRNKILLFCSCFQHTYIHIPIFL